ncbi:conjugal transfer protein TrbN (plasmid) [Zophobihabitans entericus]|uniref:Conjugal transfer protein TrbN n=1 Tax=Zophobihabitans entericus TaxID=1635327 RepID=A0A6G9IE51_9GAMM|nr:conjugal transfer protein TrbN [Zophobihabitans entericus]
MLIDIQLPPDLQNSVVCAIYAAVKYEVPVNLFLAVVEKEGGKPGQYVKNKNGTYDVGPLQFNTAYLKSLAKYSITVKDVEGYSNSCYPYDLAAWRIRGHILNDKGSIFQRAANYHSKTPYYNTIYRNDLAKRSEKWANWLDEHFITTKVSITGSKLNQSPDAN